MKVDLDLEPIEIAAQCWCDAETAHCEMNIYLCKAFEKRLTPLIKELRAASKAISYAQSLFSEDDAFNAVSHFNVAFELRNALKEYEEVVK